MQNDTPVRPPTQSLSVVVPVYSGEIYLADLVAELEKLRNKWEASDAPIRLREIILVDDGAIDASPRMIDEIAAERPYVSSIHMMRNFGQHAATIAGILHTSGDWVVTMDEDLQHPPSRIEELLAKGVERGADVVYAQAASAVHEKGLRDWSSKSFKRVMQTLSGDPNTRYFNSFRLIRGSLARATSSVCGYDTYFDVALSWFTKRIEGVVMDLKDLRYIRTGKSGYGFSRLLSHARRMLMSSQMKIMRYCGLFGLFVLAASALGAIVLVILHFFFPSTISAPGWTSLALLTLFFGGFITLLVGVVLEYVVGLTMSAQGKPIFFAVDRSQDRHLHDYFMTPR